MTAFPLRCLLVFLFLSVILLNMWLIAWLTAELMFGRLWWCHRELRWSPSLFRTDSGSGWFCASRELRQPAELCQRLILLLTDAAWWRTWSTSAGSRFNRSHVTRKQIWRQMRLFKEEPGSDWFSPARFHLVQSSSAQFSLVQPSSSFLLQKWT